MVRASGKAAVFAVVIVVLSRCGEAQVTPEWTNGTTLDDVVIGDESISIPIYSGVGGLPSEQAPASDVGGLLPPVGPSIGTPEPSSGLLAAMAAMFFFYFRRRAALAH